MKEGLLGLAPAVATERFERRTGVALPGLDGRVLRVARGRGALDLAVGEALAAMAVGDRTLRLGFSCLGDYARERLGLAGSTAEKLVRLVRALRDRPLLRDAVRAGVVSARKAETVLPVARGEDEPRWVALARVETVRALAASVKEVPGCSRAAVQVHHVTFRSRGGGDEPENLVSLCAAHHLHAVHVGWVRVRGAAPSRLRWSFRAGGGPLALQMA